MQKCSCVEAAAVMVECRCRDYTYKGQPRAAGGPDEVRAEMHLDAAASRGRA